MGASTETIPLWINGGAYTSPDLKEFTVQSAKDNGRVVYHALSADVDTAIAAVDSASAAFPTWSKKTAVERRDILTRAADIILQRKEELVKIVMEETSATEFWANLNVLAAASHVREFASRITAMSGEIPQSKLDYAFAFREPLGTVLAIPP
jgi:acyl-CoA reductase-like NAD-dependent aldehyde dehydrogenase